MPSHIIYIYNDVKMSVMVSQITNITIIYSTLYSDADQRKHLSPASLDFEIGEFPAQMASNAATVSIWWRHHDNPLTQVTNAVPRGSKLLSKLYYDPSARCICVNRRIQAHSLLIMYERCISLTAIKYTCRTVNQLLPPKPLIGTKVTYCIDNSNSQSYLWRTVTTM